MAIDDIAAGVAAGIIAGTKQDYRPEEIARFVATQTRLIEHELEKPLEQAPSTTVSDWTRTELKQGRAR